MRKVAGALLQILLLVASRAMVSVATLASVPIIITQAGTDFWVSAALGQVIGEVGRAICVWGYGGRIAYLSSLAAFERSRYFILSLWGRCMVFLLVVPALLAVVFHLANDHWQIALWMTVAGSLNGLGASWYFVATGRNRPLVLVDALPRALGILSGALALNVLPMVAQGWGMGVLVTIGSLFSVFVSTAVILKSAEKTVAKKVTTRELMTSLGEGIPTLVYSLCMTVRLSIPLSVTSATAPVNSASIALSDKFVRWGNTAASPVAEVMQAKVKDAGSSIRTQIVRTGVLSLGAGLLLCFASAVAIPYLSRLLSVGQVSLSIWDALPVSISVGAALVSSVASLALVPMIGRKWVTAGASLASLLGVAVMAYPLSQSLGAVGAMWALACGEIISIAVTYAVILSGLKTRIREGNEAPLDGVRSS